MACPLQGLCLLNGLASALAGWILVEEHGPARSAHVAAWDPGGQQFLIHGGSDAEFKPDLWTYDAENRSWDLQPLPNPAPSERADHVAIWDARERALWIHGGYDGATLLNDLWRYSGNSWTLMAGGAGQGPTARSHHVAVWDADSVIWLHGGFDGALKDDLWMFNSRDSSSSWVQVPNGNPWPSARAHHAAAWDTTNSIMWIHGGYDSRGRFGSNGYGDGDNGSLRFELFLS